MKKNISIFWHRRDLRIHDNAGLYHALKHEKDVQPIFIFDTTILDELEDKKDARVAFIHQYVTLLDQAYRKVGGRLWVYHGKPEEVWKTIVRDYMVQSVYTNRDYEPYAQKRDKWVYDFLAAKNIPFRGYKDHVMLEKNEVVKADGTPYTVFTPYSKKWFEIHNDFYSASYPVEKYVANLHENNSGKIPSLNELGFKPGNIIFPSPKINHRVVKNYHETRDIPRVNGTSRMSVHLRFGTVSIRELFRTTFKESPKYANELVWRDFYQAILFHFPHTVHSAFKPAYDRVVWRNNEKEFELWCQGKTGYPLVDAGMRELTETGHMHNRVRMVVSSFLTKHLLIDWRWGEAYFAKKLLDFELASNVGGWQWAAGCGCDAAPYFRVFNPALQQERFDPGFVYIKKWVPEFETKDYPKPIVDHTFARNRVLEVYKKALKENF